MFLSRLLNWTVVEGDLDDPSSWEYHSVSEYRVPRVIWARTSKVSDGEWRLLLGGWLQSVDTTKHDPSRRYNYNQVLWIGYCPHVTRYGIEIPEHWQLKISIPPLGRVTLAVRVQAKLARERWRE